VLESYCLQFDSHPQDVNQYQQQAPVLVPVYQQTQSTQSPFPQPTSTSTTVVTGTGYQSI
jgi:hypothetical protein